MPHSNNNNLNNNILNNDPQKIHYSHSHGHTLSTASFRSNRSGISSGNHSQISNKSGKSLTSNKSVKSGKSNKSKKSKTSQRSNKTKSSKRSKKSTKSKSSRKNGNKSHKKNIQKLENKRLRLEQRAIDIIKTYKILSCQKNKCNDIYCPKYHNYDDRRRSPFQFNYCHEPCSRIFDNKTKKFTDNGYGCPMNDSCEYAHNYLEIWYHPNLFHTKQCPIMKYQKNCPWKFKCSHYHKKSHKRIKPVTYNKQSQQQQRPSTYSPISSSAYSSHSHSFYNNNHHNNHSNVAPPNLHQHINGQNNNGHHHHHHNGPQRPPLTNNHRHHQSEINSPYSALSFDSGINNNNNNGHSSSIRQNGLISPNNVKYNLFYYI